MYTKTASVFYYDSYCALVHFVADGIAGKYAGYCTCSRPGSGRFAWEVSGKFV